MSNTIEIKHSLRKIEFPECAREAIKKIGLFLWKITSKCKIAISLKLFFF